MRNNINFLKFFLAKVDIKVEFNRKIGKMCNLRCKTVLLVKLK